MKSAIVNIMIRKIFLLLVFVAFYCRAAEGSNNNKPIVISWGDIDVRYSTHSQPAVKGEKIATLRGWKGERVSAVAEIWTSDTLKVEDYELPSPYDWNFYLDLLQNPFAVARYENLPLWSDAQLEGKTLVTCGDSFTEGDFWDYIDAEGKNDRRSPEIYESEWGCYKTYPYWIAKRNGMKLVNMAKCGATLALSADKKCECFVTEKLHSIPKDADYILFKFGINDSWRLPVGTIDDTTPDTFCGAWNIVLSWVIENCPDAKVGVIASNHCKTKEWSDATVMMCEKYGVRCLNEESEDVPYFYEQKFRACPDDIREAMNAKYRVSEKNKHPNVAAHRIESLIVEKFLRTL